MKVDFHFHFYSRIAIMAVLILTVFFWQKSVDTGAAPLPYNEVEINSFAWSDVVGWVSLNCANDFDNDGEIEPGENTCASQDYRLEVVDVAGTPYIQGCAWAGNPLVDGGDPLGWICFSDPGGTNAPTNGIGVLDSSPVVNSLNPSQFASILEFEGMGSDQWKLGFPINDYVTSTPGSDYDPDAPQSGDPISGCFNCRVDYTYACAYTGSPCIQDSDCVVVVGEDNSCVESEVFYNCDNCLEYFYYQGSCSISGNTCKIDNDCPGVETCENISTCSDDIEIDCSNNSNLCSDPSNCTEREIGGLKKTLGGYSCSQCVIEDQNNICGVNAYEGNVNRCDWCQTVYQTPGLILDNQYNRATDPERGYLCGWAWNSWGPDQGLEWFQFSPRISTSSQPYINVDQGSIYSKGNISSPYAPPFGRYNASYLIEAGGQINNFISSSTVAGEFQAERSYQPQINFFESISNGKYSNALGAIDYVGLITETSSGSQTNKYGSQIVTNANDFFDGNHLADKVLYLNSDYTIGSSVTIPVGSGLENAAGTVVIDGDLIVNFNVSYGSGAISYLRNIPSLVWLVKGDVIIDEKVSELAGTFIVLGDGNNICDGDPPASSCGQFVSCNGTSQECDDRALLVEGSVLARYFELSRGYKDQYFAPAEKFYNNGRLQTNPPSGFEDLSKLVPRFSEGPN